VRIIRAKDYYGMSRKASNIISAQIIMKPDCVLGLATGGTPMGIYRQLIEWYQKGDLDFSRVTTINLDEYCGLPREAPQSYWSFMHENLFNRVNINPANLFLPDGMNPDAAAECARYDRVIRAKGGIDLQLLGIGNDGHIGFNEPGAAFDLGTHCVELTESTVEANKRFFEKKSDVPRRAYTMGIKSIMQARKVLMVASGSGKAQIVKRALFGAVTPEIPASILQMHPDFTLIGDEEALSLISLEEETA
jgi:glucosamine-6-phosphate deaminase